MSGGGAEPSARERWALAVLARQGTVMADLQAGAELAETTPDGVGAEAAWLAVERQAERFLRHLATWEVSNTLDGCRPEVARHRAALQDRLDLARGRQGSPGQASARRATVAGLRVAVVGKGGVGKSVVSATLARILARRGRSVLAADLDTNPGMAYSLGVPPTEGALPPEAVERHDGAPYGWQLASALSPAEVVERFAAQGPDGVRFLSVGKIEEPEKEAAKRSVGAMVQLLLGFGRPGWDVVGDLEAGPTTPFERYHAFADHVLVVVGPAWRSALTARRLIPLLGDAPITVVANRFDREPDHPGLHPAVRIPADPAVVEAERLGVATIEACPGSPVVSAVEDLAAMLVPEEALVTP